MSEFTDPSPAASTSFVHISIEGLCNQSGISDSLSNNSSHNSVNNNGINNRNNNNNNTNNKSGGKDDNSTNNKFLSENKQVDGEITTNWSDECIEPEHRVCLHIGVTGTGKSAAIAALTGLRHIAGSAGYVQGTKSVHIYETKHVTWAGGKKRMLITCIDGVGLADPKDNEKQLFNKLEADLVKFVSKVDRIYVFWAPDRDRATQMKEINYYIQQFIRMGFTRSHFRVVVSHTEGIQSVHVQKWWKEISDTGTMQALRDAKGQYAHEPIFGCCAEEHIITPEYWNLAQRTRNQTRESLLDDLYHRATTPLLIKKPGDSIIPWLNSWYLAIGKTHIGVVGSGVIIVSLLKQLYAKGR